MLSNPRLVLDFVVCLLIGIGAAFVVGRSALRAWYRRSVERIMRASGADAESVELPAISPPLQPSASPGSLAAEVKRRLVLSSARLIIFFGVAGAALALLFVYVVVPTSARSFSNLALGAVVFAVAPSLRTICGYLLGRVSPFGSWGSLALLTTAAPGFVIGFFIWAARIYLFPPAEFAAELASGPFFKTKLMGLLKIGGVTACVVVLATASIVAFLILRERGRRWARLSAAAWSDCTTWLVTSAFWSALLLGSSVGDIGALRLIIWCAAVLAVPLLMVALMRATARPELVSGGLTMVFLRTFGTNSDKLLRDLGREWLEAGRIDLITGPDLARHPVSADAPLAWLTFRLRESFVTRVSDLTLPRLQAPARRIDGRYEVRDVACNDTTWRPTVRVMCQAAHVVVVDVRNFNAKHRGVSEELRMLALAVPRRRVVLVSGTATDRPLLESTLSALGERGCDLASSLIMVNGHRAARSKTLSAALHAACSGA